MSARIGLQKRIDDYVAERHRLGFQVHSRHTFLTSFANYVAAQGHRGPLTIDLMMAWARQDKWQRGTPATWAARLARLRHFILYLKQFEQDTEVPDERTFGPQAGRVAPHIYHEAEIMELLAAARKLGTEQLNATIVGMLGRAGVRGDSSARCRC